MQQQLLDAVGHVGAARAAPTRRPWAGRSSATNQRCWPVLPLELVVARGVGVVLVVDVREEKASNWS
ncbi:MAG: hypothetical protein U0R68_12885 [Candidatus Nanopelagicales bacterium]